MKTSRLTDLFLFYYGVEIFVRNLNSALVHSQVELCQFTFVYVEQQLLRSTGLLLHQTVTPSPLLTPWPLTFIERMAKKGEIVWFLSFPL